MTVFPPLFSLSGTLKKYFLPSFFILLFSSNWLSTLSGVEILSNGEPITRLTLSELQTLSYPLSPLSSAGGNTSTERGIELSFILPLSITSSEILFFTEGKSRLTLSVEKALKSYLLVRNDGVRLRDTEGNLSEPLERIEFGSVFGGTNTPLRIIYTKEIPYFIYGVELFARLQGMQIEWISLDDLNQRGSDEESKAKFISAHLAEMGEREFSEISPLLEGSSFQESFWSHSYVTLLSRKLSSKENLLWKDWLTTYSNGSAIWNLLSFETLFSLAGENLALKGWAESPEQDFGLVQLGVASSFFSQYYRTDPLNDLVFYNLDTVFYDTIDLFLINRLTPSGSFSPRSLPLLDTDDDGVGDREMSPLRKNRVLLFFKGEEDSPQTRTSTLLMRFLLSPLIQQNFPEQEGIFPREFTNVSGENRSLFSNSVEFPEQRSFSEEQNESLRLYINNVIDKETFLESVRTQSTEETG